MLQVVISVLLVLLLAACSHAAPSRVSLHRRDRLSAATSVRSSRPYLSDMYASANAEGPVELKNFLDAQVCRLLAHVAD